MPKNIYLKPDEEIVAAVDKLIQSDSDEINLIVPAGAQLWQSSINLKLLKREADYLNKKIILIVADDLGKEMAERVGFEVRKESDLDINLVGDEQDFNEQEFSTEMIDKSHEKNAKDSGENNQKKSDPKINYGLSQGQENDIIERLAEEMDAPEKKHKLSSFLSTKKKDKKINFAAFNFGNKKEEDKEKKKIADIVTPEKKKREAGSDSNEESEQIFLHRDESQEQELKKTDRIEQPRFSESDMDVLRPLPEPEKKLKKSSRGWLKWLALGLAAIILTGGIWLYFVLPTTEIRLRAVEEKISLDLTVIGSAEVSEVDEIDNKFPLQVIEVSKTKSREFEATGEKQLNEKARGFITIYNEYSSASQTLVATTRFESPEGKVFRIFETVTIPGAKIEEGKIIASSLKVEVVADQPGADYNIGPAEFTIPGFEGSPKYAGFYGKSQSAMTGGSTEKVKIVTEEDIQQAEETLVEEIKSEAEKAFQKQIPENLKLIEGAQKEETKVLSTVEPETQTDKFLVEVEGKVIALLYNQEDLERLIELNIVSKISEDKVIIPETQQIKWLEPEIDLEEGEVIFSLYADQKIAYKLDVEKIKKDLLGLKETEVRKYFANEGKIAEAKVSFRPFWAKNISNKEEKIEIIIENLPAQ